MLNPKLFFAGVAAGLTLITTPAFAGTEHTDLSSFTVTARKTEENALKIPVSLSLFTREVMEDAGISDTMELVRFAPNVYMKKSTSENMISIRGITPFDSSIYSPTAFYVDDILLPLHYMHNLDFFDLERVEVLKGPQGTLYGGNSESGVINVVTRKPGNAFEGKVSLETGTYPSADQDDLFMKAGINLAMPVQPDRLSLGLAGTFETNGGYYTNEAVNDDGAGEIRRYNGRFSLGFTPSDRLDFYFTADALKNNDNIAVYRFDTGPHRTDPHKVRHEQTDWSDETGQGQALKINYRAGGVNLLSVTGHRSYVNTNQQDYDCTDDPALNWGEIVSDYDDRIFTQELRLSSDQDLPLTWLAGLYGFSEDTRITRDNPTGGSYGDTRIDTRGWALFGQATYTLFDRLHLSAGLRYDAQYQEGQHLTRSLWGGQWSQIRLEQDQDFKEILPKFSVGWDLTPEVYTYALVSKGYMTGGYNYVMATDLNTLTYDPEYVWNHEIGVKASFLDNRLISSLSLFYLKIDDKQVYEQITGATPGTRVDNAAEAHTKGVELEITARPVAGLDITAGLGLISGEYDNWIATEWNADYTGHVKNDYSGKDLPNVPEYTYSLGVQYRFLNGIFVRGDVNGVGAFYGDHANTVKEPAYALVNLKLGYETPRFDIYFWAKNLFDKDYHTIKYAWDGNELVQDGEPMSLGISLNWRF